MVASRAGMSRYRQDLLLDAGSCAALACIAIAIQRPAMKTTTIPSLRVSPELRRQAEAVLAEGETLSSFLLQALQESIVRRRDQQEFVARGLRNAAAARASGRYLSAGAVTRKLAARLATAAARD
jgi:predicted transcriptional regulator